MYTSCQSAVSARNNPTKSQECQRTDACWCHQILCTNDTSNATVYLPDLSVKCTLITGVDK